MHFYSQIFAAVAAGGFICNILVELSHLPAGFFLLFLSLKTVKKFQWAYATVIRVCCK